MSGDLVQVPEGLVTLHKDIYLTADMLFINGIPFFLKLIRKICLTSFNHIANIKVDTILKSFKEVYSYYMKREFHITTFHAYE